MANYRNPQCMGMEEFEADVARLKYIKKSLSRYQATGDLCERLVLNHLIVLCNVFGPKVLVRLVYLKMRDHLPLIKPFLIMLRILPDRVFAVDGRDWDTIDVPMDPVIVSALRKI